MAGIKKIHSVKFPEQHGTIFYTINTKNIKRKTLTDLVFILFEVTYILGQVVVYKEHIKLGLLRFFSTD